MNLIRGPELGVTSATHVYSEPGTYTIEWDALYDDNNSIPSQFFDAVAYETVVVTAGASAPSIAVGGPVTAAVTGEEYSVRNTYFGTATDSPQSWTVAWGDGTSSVYPNYATSFTHVYTSASPTGVDYLVSVTASTDVGPLYASAIVVVAEPEMSVIEGDGSTLDHSVQQTTGAFVLVDDADDGGLYDSSGNPIPDYEQTSTTWADPDLMEVVLNPLPAAVGGTYSLSWDTGDFKVWNDPYKDTEYTTGVTFSATQETTLYVEGVSISPQAGADALELSWSNPLLGLFAGVVDKAPVTVLKVTGPQDVPAYGQYTYGLSGPINATDIPVWSAAGGNVTPVSGTQKQTAVTWNAPPANTPAGQGWNGLVSCTIAGYKINPRNVFVINMTVAAPQNGQAFQQYGVLPAITDTANGKKMPQIRTVVQARDQNGDPGVTYGAAITVSGPTYQNIANIGVEGIAVGFVQNVIGYLNNGTYSHGTMTSSVQNLIGSPPSQNAVVDKLADSTGAWNNSKNDYNKVGYFAGFKHQTAVAATLTATLSGEDSPGNGPPLTWDMADHLPLPEHSDILDTMQYEETFMLYICAQAKFGTHNDYVVSANAQWAVNGDGSIVLNAQNNYSWNGAKNSGVTVPGAWSLVPPSNNKPASTNGNKIMNNLTGVAERWIKS